MQDQQFEGALRCLKHNVPGCVPCAEESALTRNMPSVGVEEFVNRKERRIALFDARRKQIPLSEMGEEALEASGIPIEAAGVTSRQDED